MFPVWSLDYHPFCTLEDINHDYFYLIKLNVEMVFHRPNAS